MDIDEAAIKCRWGGGTLPQVGKLTQLAQEIAGSYQCNLLGIFWEMDLYWCQCELTNSTHWADFSTNKQKHMVPESLWCVIMLGL